jgi:hypothetical protein
LIVDNQAYCGYRGWRAHPSGCKARRQHGACLQLSRQHGACLQLISIPTD